MNAFPTLALYTPKDTEIIARLVDDDPLPRLLGDVHAWSRRYGRRTTGTSTFATLVYEREQDPASAVCIDLLRDSTGFDLEGLGHPHVTPLWEDPALPSLTRLRAHHAGILPVRYRPKKRCTLFADGDVPQYLKCFRDTDVATMFTDAQRLYAAAVQGQFGFGVARPINFDADERIFVQAAVPGVCVGDRMKGQDACALAARIGTANASFVASRFSPSAHFSYADQYARTAKYVRKLAKFVPALTSELKRLMVRLQMIDAPAHRHRPLHGAPHPHQWLDGPAGLMLVDFDRMAWGDPELEAASFVAEVDFEPEGEHIGNAYYGAFTDHIDLDDKLFAAYRTHKHLAKALKYAESIRTDGVARSIAIVSSLTQGSL